MKTTARIFDIMRFAVQDGPGIRTTVFLKGCRLRCRWCHNPESQRTEIEIAFAPEQCGLCGYCVESCIAGCHQFREGEHHYDRTRCRGCGRCTLECPTGALELIGREATVPEVLGVLLKDRDFYRQSGGGITFSGGEPMLQAEFIAALLEEPGCDDLHVCVETSGVAPREHFAKLLDKVDLFLFDFKESDPARHLEYTGSELAPVLATLDYLDRAGAAIRLRCPIIPGLNDRGDHFRSIARLADRHAGIKEIELLPFHPLGIAKYQRLGREFELKNLTDRVDDSVVGKYLAEVRQYTAKPVSAE